MNHGPFCHCYMCHAARAMDNKLAKLVDEIPGPDTPEPETIESLRAENAKLTAERDQINRTRDDLLRAADGLIAERDALRLAVADADAERKSMAFQIDALTLAVADAEVVTSGMVFMSNSTSAHIKAWGRFCDFCNQRKAPTP